MGDDPYPEEEAQQKLTDLIRTADADRTRVGAAIDGWTKLAECFESVAANLGPGGNRWDERGRGYWLGEASAAAVAAFDSLAARFTQHAAQARGVVVALEMGRTETDRVQQTLDASVGRELKPKPKGGLGGLVSGGFEAMGDVVKNPTSIVTKGGLVGAIASNWGPDEGEISREEQFNRIRTLHDESTGAMGKQKDAVEGACPEANRTNQMRSAGTDFNDTRTGSGASISSAGGPTGGAASHSATSIGGGPTGSSYNPSGTDAPYTPAASLGSGPNASGIGGYSNTGVTADGAMGGVVPGYEPPGGTGGAGSTSAFGGSGGGIPGAGMAAGIGGAAAGLGGAAGAAIGASRAGGSGIGGAAGAGGTRGGMSGMIGGTPGGAAAGAGVRGGTGAGAGAGGRPGGMGMMGGMGAGGAGGGGSAGGGGARYGSGPQLSERDKRRRRGLKHAALGAGSRRGAGEEGEEDASRRTAAEEDDPFFDDP